jgi:hypothetical protein
MCGNRKDSERRLPSYYCFYAKTLYSTSFNSPLFLRSAKPPSFLVLLSTGKTHDLYSLALNAPRTASPALRIFMLCLHSLFELSSG